MLKLMKTINIYRYLINCKYKIIVALLSLSGLLLTSVAIADQLKDHGERERRPCDNTVSLIIDGEEKWNRSLEELREQDSLVHFTETPVKDKYGIPLKDLLSEANNVQTMILETCTGKVRRFDRDELNAKQDSLYFILTTYRGIKLHNAKPDQTKKKKKGSRLKNIDKILLFTQPVE
jgi:hypothetical protein